MVSATSAAHATATTPAVIAAVIAGRGLLRRASRGLSMGLVAAALVHLLKLDLPELQAGTHQAAAHAKGIGQRQGPESRADGGRL